jgi:ATP-dependent DNA ligase
VRLITCKGNDFGVQFLFIAVTNLPARSCLIDGEAIVTDDTGLAVFELIRRQRTSAAAVLCASICSNWKGRTCAGCLSQLYSRLLG